MTATPLIYLTGIFFYIRLVPMKEFNLIGDIGIDITPVGVNQMLAEANGDDVTFYMASLGGSLSDGNSIYGIIKNYKGNTKGVIIGHTASAGTIAILGCDAVECNSNSPFLIHNSSIPEGGNAAELKKKASELEKQDKMMLRIYQGKTGLPEAKIAELMAKEDWLTPEEALSFGFIDSVIEPQYKAVAYYSASSISEVLQTKLEKKMNIFKKNKDAKPHLLALKDGRNILASAEAAAEGVEVAPLGAMTLEDGEYELSDGRKISVSGGVITEVKEMEAAADAPTAADEATVNAVAAIVAESEARMRTEFAATLKKETDAIRASIKSTHVPVRGKEINARVAEPDKVDVHDRVQAKADEIRNKIVESRNA